MFAVLFMRQTYTYSALAPYCKRQVLYSVVINSRDWQKESSLEYTVLQKRAQAERKGKTGWSGILIAGLIEPVVFKVPDSEKVQHFPPIGWYFPEWQALYYWVMIQIFLILGLELAALSLASVMEQPDSHFPALWAVTQASFSCQRWEGPKVTCLSDASMGSKHTSYWRETITTYCLP